MTHQGQMRCQVDLMPEIELHDLTSPRSQDYGQKIAHFRQTVMCSHFLQLHSLIIKLLHHKEVLHHQWPT